MDDLSASSCFVDREIQYCKEPTQAAAFIYNYASSAGHCLPHIAKQRRSIQSAWCNSKPAAAMGPPKPPVPHVAPIYRVTATALGAGMWFWLMYRAKKDGKTLNSHTRLLYGQFLTSGMLAGPALLGWKHPWDH
ncbi:hypothetical protein CCMA1212_007995 [Trichoderma ghanense]|uniref:HIG1 domain-containing protein n=1 Tax=Trichoderma ghanense TaxID=65468 RepID=A0ABY2GW12_9HYPO